jgi:hypothetical protein
MHLKVIRKSNKDEEDLPFKDEKIYKKVIKTKVSK